MLKVEIAENKPYFMIINSFRKSQEVETLQLEEVAYLQHKHEKFYIKFEELNGSEAICPLEIKQGVAKYTELAQFV